MKDFIINEKFQTTNFKFQEIVSNTCSAQNFNDSQISFETKKN